MNKRERGVQPPNGNGISEEAERRITYAIAIAFICLLPSAILGAFLWFEVQSRTDANTELIEKLERNEVAQEKIRVEARRAIRKADIANCEADELVKARLRKIVAFDPEQVALTLQQLGIDPDSQRGRDLTARSKANADEAVSALKARDCSLLPDPNQVIENGGNGS